MYHTSTRDSGVNPGEFPCMVAIFWPTLTLPEIKYMYKLNVMNELFKRSFFFFQYQVRLVQSLRSCTWKVFRGYWKLAILYNYDLDVLKNYHYQDMLTKRKVFTASDFIKNLTNRFTYSPKSRQVSWISGTLCLTHWSAHRCAETSNSLFHT